MIPAVRGMAKLIVNPTSSSRREIALSRTVLSIGRDPSNDVVLPDAMVSRRHAVVEWRGSQYFLRDCNSSNGSLVNGDRVSERSLRDGDLVAIGTARLLFRDDVVVDEPGAKVVQHPSAPRLHCPACNADYRKGDLFCRQCGGALAPSPPEKVVCTSCGTAVALPAKFCNACGHPLETGEERTTARPLEDVDGPPPPPRAPAAPQGPPVEGEAASSDTTERRPTEGAAEEASVPVPPALAPAIAESGGGGPARPEMARPPESARPPAPAIHAASVLDLPRASSAGRFTPAPMSRPSSAPVPSMAAIPRALPPVRPKAAAPSVASAARVEAPAGFLPRLAAGSIDALLAGFGQLLVLSPVLYYWWSRRPPVNPADVSFLPILLSLFVVPVVAALGGVYYVYYWGVKGATPGKRLLGLVVQGDDGSEPIGLSRATIRVLGYFLSGLVLGFGFLMIAFGGVALHDRIAGTRVVRRGRG